MSATGRALIAQRRVPYTSGPGVALSVMSGREAGVVGSGGGYLALDERRPTLVAVVRDVAALLGAMPRTPNADGQRRVDRVLAACDIADTSTFSSDAGWYYPAEMTLPGLDGTRTMAAMQRALVNVVRHGWPDMRRRMTDMIRDAGLLNVGTVPVGRRVRTRAESGDDLDPVRALVLGDPTTAWWRTRRASGRSGPGVVMLAYRAGAQANTNAAAQVAVGAAVSALVERMRGAGYVVGCMGVAPSVDTFAPRSGAPRDDDDEGQVVVSWIVAKPGAPVPPDMIGTASACLGLHRVGVFRIRCGMAACDGWQVPYGLGKSVAVTAPVARAAALRHGMPSTCRVLTINRPRDGTPDAARRLVLDALAALREQ